MENHYNYASYNMDIDIDICDKSLIQRHTYNKNDVQYNILNYDTKMICFDDQISSRYRSIIVSTPENQIISFSPPKSLSFTFFMMRNPIFHSNIYINEWIEGVMVNLFFDKRIQKWEISTKSALGGQCYFYYNQRTCENINNKTTFYEMFMDALKIDRHRQLNDIPMLAYFDKNYSYSFVLQHPDNHIVIKHTIPKLYLVGVYDINIFNRVISIPPNVFEHWNIFQGLIDFPKQYNMFNYKEIMDQVNLFRCEKGLMITDLNTGERASAINPRYEQYKKIRKINANIYYQYLCLRYTGKIESFLTDFSSYEKLFYELEITYKQYILDIHSSYLSFYVKKEGRTIDDRFMYHIKRIHTDHYIPALRNKAITKPKIRKEDVDKYFRNLDPKEQLYHLYYDSRKFSIVDSLQND